MRAYFHNIYAAISTVLIGMRITFREMFHASVTHQYPYERSYEKKNIRPIHDGFRGQLFNRVEDCIGCKKCAMVCPVDCIYIETGKLGKGVTLSETQTVVLLKDRTMWVGDFEGDAATLEPGTVVKLRDGDGSLHEAPSEKVAEVYKPMKRRLTLERFDIDMALCMYCGLCTEACPTASLYMTKTYEYSTFDRKDLLFHFADLSLYEGLGSDSSEQDTTDAVGEEAAS